MNKIVKDTCILLLITLISGVGLGFVYNITAEPRARQAEKVKMKAYQIVFSDAKSFGKPIELDTKEINAYITDADQRTKASDTDNVNADINAVIDEAVPALDENGEILGYIITVTDNEAYGGSIQFSVGICNDGTVNGISFLSISETPGLGMKASQDSFMEQFKNKKVEYFKYTKTGATGDESVDALSGATITTNAVTNGVTAAIYCFDYITGGDTNE